MYTHRISLYRFLTFALTQLLGAAVFACPQSTAAQGGVSASTVPDSLEGFQSQIDEFVRIAKDREQRTYYPALDSFGLPDPDAWLAANFEASQLAEVKQNYLKMLDGHKSHISWVLGNNVDAPGFSLVVETSQVPPPLQPVGFESLLPRPRSPLVIENFRLTPKSTGTVPPSWVSSFVYVDGRFRFIGGTYPFWAESLNGSRGPMALPPAQIRGMTVQGRAFHNDQPGNGIVAVVQMKIEVGHNGRVKHIQVLSGDPAFVKDAKEYVQHSEFPPLPKDPRLAQAKLIWDFEVAFFSPKV
jgi:hypothetical protein